MTILLEFRERLKALYGNNEGYFKILIRFVVALAVFMMITQNIGFMSRLQNPAILLVLALVCAFLPVNVTLFVSAVLIIAHLSAASLEFSLVMLIIFLILILLYFRFAPSCGYVVLLMPLACSLHIPFAVPIVLGLLATPVTAVPVACGTMIYYLLQYAKTYAASMSGSGIENMFKKYEYIIEHALKNPEMFAMIIALVAVLVIVYLIRRLSLDYAWLVAIVAGGVFSAIIMLCCDYVIDIPVDIPVLCIGIVGAVLIAFVVRFFAFNVDYTRTERVQFEDDEYYYYVKAVPKVTIAAKEKSVKRLTVSKKLTVNRREDKGDKEKEEQSTEESED